MKGDEQGGKGVTRIFIYGLESRMAGAYVLHETATNGEGASSFLSFTLSMLTSS